MTERLLKLNGEIFKIVEYTEATITVEGLVPNVEPEELYQMSVLDNGTERDMGTLVLYPSEVEGNTCIYFRTPSAVEWRVSALSAKVDALIMTLSMGKELMQNEESEVLGGSEVLPSEAMGGEDGTLGSEEEMDH